MSAHDERLALKAQLTAKGVSIPIDTPTPELQAMLAAAKVGKGKRAVQPAELAALPDEKKSGVRIAAALHD